ncbi:MAG TPA: murein biosynthesis integral membrane protein MurJ [Patescibacteria group bacterium]|nr:murein biosynthesis integral membrane protein MurJ [Patescibacteria group bacterium]
MLRRLFAGQQTSILSAAFVIAAMVAASRVLGLIRNRLLTDRFSAIDLDPYFAAFRIPNFIFEVLVIGTVSVAFIPVFTSFISRHKKQEAYELASSAISIALVGAGVFSLIFLIFTPVIVKLIAPGFSSDKHELMTSFVRLLIIFQVFPLVVGNFLTGIMQSFKRFLVPALAPVVYNVGIIIGILFLTPVAGLYAPVYGVILGAFLFMLIHLPFLSGVGYQYKPRLDFKSAGIKKIGKLMLPRTIAVAVSQIDATIDVMLSSVIGAGSVTIFTLAQQLQLVPIGLFSMPIAQAALPTLSEYVAQGKLERFKESFLTSLHQIWFLVMPASVFLMVMNVPVVRLVYGADQFDWPSTSLTGDTLTYFAISLFAQGAIQILSRAFFALQDSKTPVVFAIASILFNSILSIIFVLGMKVDVSALGLSTSIASILHAGILLYALDKRVGGFDRRRLIIPFIKITAAAVLMGIILRLALELQEDLIFDTTRTLSLIMLTGVASSIGLFTYIFFAWFFNIEEVILFYRFAKKLTRVKDILFESSREVSNERPT